VLSESGKKEGAGRQKAVGSIRSGSADLKDLRRGAPGARGVGERKTAGAGGEGKEYSSSKKTRDPNIKKIQIQL